MVPGARLSYRPGLVRVGAVVYALFALWWLVALLAGPDPAHAFVVGGWLAAVGVLVHAMFWRPAVVVDDDAVLLRNVLRDVRVPWSRLEGIETRFTLTLLTGDARHQSWAASAPGRPSTVHGLRQATGAGAAAPAGHSLPDPTWVSGGAVPSRASQDLTADSGAAAFMVRQRWTAWEEAHPASRRDPESLAADQVRVSWVLWQPAALAGCALLAVLAGVAGL